ncbi:MAG: hypothetical protein CENE_01748 [Candidatus Celerinatantimonas neptuna]|nr:MAG: hypothetical protein CENE_01748 [Candidatus Celerinatantimonas neptuna]
MPIEVKQMVIQSNITSAANQTSKAENQHCNSDGYNGLSLRKGEQLRALREIHLNIHQDIRER